MFLFYFQILEIKPHMTVETAWTYHTKAIDFIFYKTPSSSPSLRVTTKYDLISDLDTTMTIRVMTAEGPVVDISGVMKPQSVSYCNGFMIDAKVRTSMIGDVDIQSEICKPAFMKMITKRPQSNKVYITKLGIQLPHTAEISITEANEFGFNKRPITVLGLELISPTYLKTKMAGNFQETIMIMVSCSSISYTCLINTFLHMSYQYFLTHVLLIFSYTCLINTFLHMSYQYFLTHVLLIFSYTCLINTFLHMSYQYL